MAPRLTRPTTTAPVKFNLDPATQLPLQQPPDLASHDRAAQAPPAQGDILAAAGIRPWCRGLILILSHRDHLNLTNILDAVVAAADSGGLSPQESALLTEVRAGAIGKEHQHVQRIS